MNPVETVERATVMEFLSGEAIGLANLVLPVTSGIMINPKRDLTNLEPRRRHIDVNQYEGEHVCRIIK
ncbi:hypothetical protein J6590_067195 [Homalodisca vitripennis]|nr:hypothetical protein J6590_067195 [Homalodisca vitripennis]